MRREHPTSRLIPRNEIFLDVESGAGGPLEIETVRALAVPNFAVFRSSGEQELRFLFGNPIARRPDYELEAFNDLLGGTVKTPVVVSTPPTQNPDYLPAEPLPGFAGTAAPFDARGWGSRKRIRVRQPGIQSLELDPIPPEAFSL